jgi:acyl-homoserine lactone acylase PvdQ
MFAISKARFGKHGKVKKPGTAYLFNGPQLGFSVPELFVEFEVSSPAQHVRGVSAAGIPLVGIGHNSRVAWGFTSGESDEDDLYAEKLTGDETYSYKGAERHMDCRDEQFQYRTPPTDLPGTLGNILGGSTQPAAGVQTERICRTVHGPVQARGTGWAYARRYAVWGRELETIVGLSQLNDARDIKGVDRAMRKVTWNENVIAADSSGSIGYWHPGLHPLRPRGFDERLPFPGTGGAEWRGLLPRSRTPHVINPKRGWLFNWNNMPSVGWTNGDGGERERMAGPYHRSAWLRRLVQKVARHPSYTRARAIDRSNGTVAQQRPIYGKRLRQARKGSKGVARSVLSELIRWDGHYDRVDKNNTVDPGVAIWEQFKSDARGLVFGRYGSTANLLDAQPGTSHQFDISNEEAYALRRLSRRGLRLAATRAAANLTKRFGTGTIAAWREPRRMYEVSAQGAAAIPELPFFDRGTWQESVAVGP